MRLRYQKYRKSTSCTLRCILILILASCGGVSLQSCTTKLTASKIEESTDTGVKGQVYYLARTNFAVELDRELKKCEMGYANTEEPIWEWLREQAIFINGRDDLKTAETDYQALLKDSKLQESEVVTFLENELSKDWKERGKPTDDKLGMLLDLINQSARGKSEIKAVLKVGMKATIKPIILTDLDHAYAIQYDGMSSGVKSTNYSVETYPNGTLKGINVTLTDQTGEIVQSTLSGVVKIAAAAGGFPISAVMQRASQGPVVNFEGWYDAHIEAMQLCSADIRLKIKVKDNLENQHELSAKENLGLFDDVTEEAGEIDKIEEELAEQKKKLKDKVEGEPAYAELVIAVKEVTKKLIEAQKVFSDLNDSLKKSTKKHSMLAKKFLKARKSLTITTVTEFIPEAEVKMFDKDKNELVVSESKVFSVNLNGIEYAIDQWMREKIVNQYCGVQKAACIDGVPKVLFAEVAVHPSLYKLTSVTEQTAGHVVYRQPVKTPIWVCKEQHCFNESTFQVQEKNILLSSTVDIPQLGVLASLPLSNGSFQNNTLSASFLETGALTKLSYTSNAAVAAAADTFQKSAEIYMQYREAKLGEEKLEIERAQAESSANTEFMKTQLEEEKAKDALEAYKASKSDSSE